MISFGLICEGASEYCILRYITERYLGDDIVLNPKQPENKGGKQVGHGGWLNVLNYCTEINFNDILATNDYIIIQIDTDTCEEIGYDIKVRREDGSIKSDDELYEEISQRILKNIPIVNRSKYNDKIIFAICFNETECWLLPIYYTDNRKCSTTGCIKKLNQKLSKQGLGIPEKDKNSTNAQKVYNTILKNIKKPEHIKEYSECNYGFKQFIEQLDQIKRRINRKDLIEGVSIVEFKNKPVLITTLYNCNDCLVKDDKGKLYVAFLDELKSLKS